MLRLCSSQKLAAGFTLIEVIVVIVVLSILATLGGKFVVESTQSYQATQTRSRLINTSRQALERMSRQLRIALPYSVRLTNPDALSQINMCIEFMPIAGGGNYLGELKAGAYTGYVPDALNKAAASDTIIVSPHTIDFGTAFFVSIGAMSAEELYGATAGSRATLILDSVSQINFSPARGWIRNSVNRRFYLLDRPQAFCVVNNQLRFYSNQDAAASEVDLASASSLLAENVVGTTAPFALTAGSENRNTVVQFSIVFGQGSALSSNAQSLVMNHSVMIRNVP